MELFQVSDGCIPNSKDSKTEVLFTWEQMWCYNHHELQSRSLGHVICPIQTLTLQKVLSLTEVNQFTFLWCYSESYVFVFPSGIWFKVKFLSLYSWGVRVSPSGPTQAHLDLPSACAPASFPALSEGFLFPHPASLAVGPGFPWSFSLVPPDSVPLQSVSVLAAPVPSQLHPSWHMQLFHKNFKEERTWLCWAVTSFAQR